MAFKISATGPTGAVEVFSAADAKEAIAKYQELEKAGYPKIDIRNEQNRTLKFQEVVMLSAMANPNA
jgi:hypothetical protein